MAKSKIQSEIAKLEKVIADPKTPADVKRTLMAALENAKKHLSDAAGADKKSVKKITSTHKGENALADCREIIKKYEAGKHTEKKRIEKRVAAGKPEKLTPAETIGKAAKSVKKKIEEKPLTKPQFEAALKKIVEMVKAIQAQLATDSERFAFAHRLIEELEELRRYPKKAEKGMHIEEGKKYLVHPDAQIDVFGYKTENFTHEAKEYFEELIGDGGVGTHARADVVAMARDFDELLAIFRKATQGLDIYQGDCVAAIRYLMRGMYYSYPAITHAKAEIYPAFITTNMLRIARELKKGSADAGLHVATGKPFAEGGEVVEEISIQTANPDTAEEIKEWLNLPKGNAFIYDIKASDVNGKKEYALVRKRKMAEGGAINIQPVGYLSKDWTREQAERFVKANNEDNKGGVVYKIEKGPDDEDNMWAIVRKMMFGGVVNVAAPDNLAAKDNGGEQFLAPSFEKGGKVKSSIYEVKEVKNLHWNLNGPDGEPYFSCKVIFAKGLNWKGGEFLVTFETDSDREVNVNTVRAIDVRNPEKHIAAHQAGYALNLFFIDKLGQDYGLSAFTELKKGGKISFKQKQKAIAKSLKGKPVPKKYQDDYGKRYGSVTADIAARRIAGSIVKKEKKMFGGLVNVAAPNNLAAKDNGGEQFLAPSV